MRYILNFQDIQLASPLFLWIGLLLAVVLAVWFEIFSTRNGKDNIEIVELDFSMKSGFSAASIAHRVKTALVVLMVLLLAVLAAEPFTQSFEGSVRIESTQRLRTTVAVVDVSGSMANASGFDDVKFNVVRDSLVDFLRQAENIRASTIFFSKEATALRWFTHNTNALADDISTLKIKTDEEENYQTDAYEGLGLVQVRKISGGTHTPKALELAEDLFSKLDIPEEELGKSASIILFSDLQDNLDEVSQQIRNFTAKGVRIYVISIAKPGKLEEFKQKTAASSDLVNVFRVDNQQEVQEAFAQIGSLESSKVTIEETVQLEKSLSGEFGVFLFTVMMLYILLSETILHTVRKGGE